MPFVFPPRLPARIKGVGSEVRIPTRKLYREMQLLRNDFSFSRREFVVKRIRGFASLRAPCYAQGWRTAGAVFRISVKYICINFW